MTNSSIARSRAKLLTVIGCFVVPLVVAVIGFYFFPQLFLSEKTVNHGVLVHPARPLGPFTNLRLDGKEITLAELQKKWAIVHRLGDSCDEVCAKSLYNTRQIRKALGKDSNRLHRIMLGSNISLMEQAAATHPYMMRLLRVQGGLDTQLTPIAEEFGLDQNDALLIDPLGNVMMVVPAGLDPRDLLKDLKKLLRLSKIG